MQPSAIRVISSLPLSPNGKLDRAALPQIGTDDVQEYQAPQTDTERALAQLWQELLEAPKPVSAAGNFFRLGGHSLLATRMLLDISRRCGIDLQLKDVFERQTLAELAQHIDTQSKSTSVPDGGWQVKGSAEHVELDW
jgi:acyl carrier protein